MENDPLSPEESRNLRLPLSDVRGKNAPAVEPSSAAVEPQPSVTAGKLPGVEPSQGTPCLKGFNVEEVTLPFKEELGGKHAPAVEPSNGAAAVEPQSQMAVGKLPEVQPSKGTPCLKRFDVEEVTFPSKEELGGKNAPAVEPSNGAAAVEPQPSVTAGKPPEVQPSKGTPCLKGFDVEEVTLPFKEELEELEGKLKGKHAHAVEPSKGRKLKGKHAPAVEPSKVTVAAAVESAGQLSKGTPFHSKVTVAAAVESTGQLSKVPSLRRSERYRQRPLKLIDYECSPTTYRISENDPDLEVELVKKPHGGKIEWFVQRSKQEDRKDR